MFITYHKRYKQWRQKNLEECGSLMSSHVKQKLITRHPLIQKWVVSEKERIKCLVLEYLAQLMMVEHEQTPYFSLG